MTVDSIFQLCQDNNTKFFALQILDDAINVSLIDFYFLYSTSNAHILLTNFIIQFRVLVAMEHYRRK